MHGSPADRVVAAYQSEAHVAVALSRHGLTVSADAVRKWRAPRAVGGGGGLVPAKYQGFLLADARATGLPLTAEDLVGTPQP